MPDIRRKLPGTPDDLAEIVERATRKKPEDRYRDAGQLLQALEKFAAGSEIALPPEPILPPRINGRTVDSEAAFAQALEHYGPWCEALIGDPRAQRRLQGWLTSVGGPGHSQAFRTLMEVLRDSPEDPWRQQERLIRFFDPNRPIRVGPREIKVSGNLAYAEREVLSSLDEALPSLAPEEIERIGWALTVCLESRLPARAGLYRKLSNADVIELGWQRDPKRGFRTRDRQRLETLQDVTLHFLRQPESYDERLLAQERVAFLARTLPEQRDTGLSELAYLAFPAEGQRAIRFDGLVVDEDGYALHYGIDRSLARFLKHEGVRPGIVNPLKGAMESVSLTLEDVPEPFRQFPAEVASRLEGKLWEKLGCPKEPPAGWWVVQQQLARAARDKVHARVAAPVATRGSPRRQGVAMAVALVAAGLLAGAALVFFLGPLLRRSDAAVANRTAEKTAGEAEAEGPGIPSSAPVAGQGGTKPPTSGSRGHDGSIVSVPTPVAQTGVGKPHPKPKVHVDPAPATPGPALVVPIPDVALPEPMADPPVTDNAAAPAAVQVVPVRSGAPAAASQ